MTSFEEQVRESHTIGVSVQANRKQKRVGQEMEKASKAKRGKKRVKMIRQDYEAVVAYIEIPENFCQVTGGERKTKVGSKCMSKAKAFQIMASHLSNVNGFPDVTGEEMKKRYERYVSMYKKARQFKESTGRGLSEKEVERGVTIEEKLEKLCPHFNRMHAILGQRANIAPPAEESCGLPDSNGIDLLGLDSQLSHDHGENADADDEDGESSAEEDEDMFPEGVTAAESNDCQSNKHSHSPNAQSSPIPIVDLDYGSNDDAEEYREDFPYQNLQGSDDAEGVEDEQNGGAEQDGEAEEDLGTHVRDMEDIPSAQTRTIQIFGALQTVERTWLPEREEVEVEEEE
ncbi:hypothetical protein R1sor_004993 [Riccia sorocarpa]|uniref:Nucleolar protein 16 n=1 Tax=Riccia sorocarpa TaxID=122646 RepID=A0ABD3HL80_9MARC